MRETRMVRYFVWSVLLGNTLLVLGLPSRAAETLESPALRLELNTSPYSFRVIEKSGGEVLVSETGGITFTSNGYTVRNATDGTKAICSMGDPVYLEGPSKVSHASFT